MPIKMQESPNRWSCLPTSFAMALGVKLKFLIEKIGHDGSEIIRPDLPEPNCYLGFHIQEMISYCQWLGHSVTPIEPLPRHAAIGEYGEYTVEFPGGNDARLIKALKENVGVLTGQTLVSGQHHAVCWDGYVGKIYNPNGQVQRIQDFAINTFWCIRPVKM